MLTKSHTPFTLSTTHASQHQLQSSCVSSHLQSTSKHTTLTYKRVLVREINVTPAKPSNLNCCENVNSEEKQKPNSFHLSMACSLVQGYDSHPWCDGSGVQLHSRLLLLCYSLDALRRRPKMSDRISEIQADHESNIKWQLKRKHACYTHAHTQPITIPLQ